MSRATFKIIFFLVGIVILLSIIDLFAQFIGIIPVLGDIADLLSNSTLELMQIVLSSIIALVIKKVERF